ncbi:MAG: dihydroorotase [Ruminococcus sp.]|nr:dihydroorotase [Oscillospiraceae bacterium]MDY4414337.1 dihydroorotase [Ruminococcus sp.]
MTDNFILKNVKIKDSKEPCDIFVSEGIIKRIGKNISEENTEVFDCTGLNVINGLFDMHVHFRDPGFTHKEDIITGTRSALAGGVTGVLCMPNTNPPVDNPETLKYIYDKARDTGVEVRQTVCITKGMKGNELCDYEELKNAGASALSDDGRPVENAELMRKALELSNKNNLLITSHCEDLSIINGGIMNKGIISEKLGVKGMDRASENTITAREIILAESVNARIHIAHVSTAESIEIIRQAKKNGIRVTCETCPHYFMLTDEKLLAEDADFRMNPPLRTQNDVNAVIEGIIDGTVDCIVTDHAPHTAEEKKIFSKAPNGVVGLETSLSATLTALYHTGKISLQRVIELMSVNPRKILGLEIHDIKEGECAEFTVVDLERVWTVEPEKLHSKSKNTVFKGMTLKGKPLMTVTKGKIRYNEM